MAVPEALGPEEALTALRERLDRSLPDGVLAALVREDALVRADEERDSAQRLVDLLDVLDGAVLLPALVRVDSRLLLGGLPEGPRQHDPSDAGEPGDVRVSPPRKPSESEQLIDERERLLALRVLLGQLRARWTPRTTDDREEIDGGANAQLD